MIFGSPEHFAVEAIVEPDSKFGPVLGANVVGRVRLFFAGIEVGDFAEPACVLGAIGDHLVTLCATGSSLWHSALAGLSAKRQFEILDDAVFLGKGAEELQDLARCIFLTNVSEAFGDVKGFLLCPESGELHALLRFTAAGEVKQFVLSISKLCAVASEFANWIAVQEKTLLPSHAYADRISKVEAELAQQITESKRPSADTLDALLGALLSLVSGFGRRASDSVLIEYEEQSGSGYFGTGIAILVSGQLVEPVAFHLTLDSERGTFAAGDVRFGHTEGADVRYGSSEHGKMSKSILANPRAHRDCHYIFSRTTIGWTVSETRPNR
jgi:hypothetical protein